MPVGSFRGYQRGAAPRAAPAPSFRRDGGHRRRARRAGGRPGRRARLSTILRAVPYGGGAGLPGVRAGDRRRSRRPGAPPLGGSSRARLPPWRTRFPSSSSSPSSQSLATASGIGHRFAVGDGDSRGHPMDWRHGVVESRMRWNRTSGSEGGPRRRVRKMREQRPIDRSDARGPGSDGRVIGRLLVTARLRVAAAVMAPERSGPNPRAAMTAGGTAAMPLGRFDLDISSPATRILSAHGRRTAI